MPKIGSWRLPAGTATSGSGDSTWTNASNITADDTSYASVTADLAKNESTNKIYASNFNFTSDNINPDATITWIDVRYKAWQTNASASAVAINTEIYVTSGEQSSTGTLTLVDTSDTNTWRLSARGGNYTMWGLSGNELDPSEVETTQFGVHITGLNLDDSNPGEDTNIHIDAVQMRVRWELEFEADEDGTSSTSAALTTSIHMAADTTWHQFLTLPVESEKLTNPDFTAGDLSSWTLDEGSDGAIVYQFIFGTTDVANVTSATDGPASLSQTVSNSEFVDGRHYSVRTGGFIAEDVTVTMKVGVAGDLTRYCNDAYTNNTGDTYTGTVDCDFEMDDETSDIIITVEMDRTVDSEYCGLLFGIHCYENPAYTSHVLPAELSTEITFACDVTNGSTATAALTTATNLAGTATGTSTAEADLSIASVIAAEVSGDATATADLTTAIEMEAYAADPAEHGILTNGEFANNLNGWTYTDTPNAHAEYIKLDGTLDTAAAHFGDLDSGVNRLVNIYQVVDALPSTEYFYSVQLFYNDASHDANLKIGNTGNATQYVDDWVNVGDTTDDDGQTRVFSGAFVTGASEDELRFDMAAGGDSPTSQYWYQAELYPTSIASTATAATLSTALTFAAAVTGDASTTVALTTAIEMDADVSGDATATGALSVPIGFEGSISGDAEIIEASLTTGITMAADATGDATIVNASLDTAFVFEAQLAAAASVAAALTTVISLAGDVSGDADATATITTNITFGAEVSGDATATGDLDTAILFSVGVSGGSVVTGDLSTAIAAAADITGDATAAGALDTRIRFASQISGAATTDGDLDTEIHLAADIAGDASYEAILQVGGADLYGTLVGSATATADLDNAIQMAASATGAAAVSNAILSTEITFNGAPTGTAVATADLDTVIFLLAEATGTSSATGVLPNNTDLAAGISAGSSATADLLLGADEFAAAVTGSSTAVGALAEGILIAGEIYGDAAAEGYLAIQAQFSAQITGDARVTGWLLGTQEQITGRYIYEVYDSERYRIIVKDYGPDNLG